jgi:hypothetical protein
MPEAAVAPAPTAAPSKPAAIPAIGAQAPVSPAMARSFERMNKMATPEPVESGKPKAEPPKQPTPDPKAKQPTETPEAPEATETPEAPVDELDGEAEGETTTEPKGTPPAEGEEGKEKGAPSWKLVQSYKKEAKALKKELAELRGASGNVPQIQEQLKSAGERAEAAEKRVKELSDHMRFVDYQKSDDFVKNHQQPWERACAKAAKDLSGLNLQDANGNARKATINDLMSLCSMELGQAREQADAWFGSSADDVMDHRRKLNELVESQQLALEDAKKNGEERWKTQTESYQKLQNETASLWQKFNNEAAQKYEYLKPKEGDEEFNSKLTHGKSLVDKAFTGNALDPKLSAEDRAKLVQAQVAVRNRAIAYSTLKLENKRLQAKLSEHEKALKEFQGSEPTTGRGKNAAAPTTPADPMQAAFQRMQKPKYLRVP